MKTYKIKEQVIIPGKSIFGRIAGKADDKGYLVQYADTKASINNQGVATFAGLKTSYFKTEEIAKSVQ